MPSPITATLCALFSLFLRAARQSENSPEDLAHGLLGQSFCACGLNGFTNHCRFATRIENWKSDLTLQRPGLEREVHALSQEVDEILVELRDFLAAAAKLLTLFAG